jgi:hypothetical protein
LGAIRGRLFCFDGADWASAAGPENHGPRRGSNPLGSTKFRDRNPGSDRLAGCRYPIAPPGATPIFRLSLMRGRNEYDRR